MQGRKESTHRTNSALLQLPPQHLVIHNPLGILFEFGKLVAEPVGTEEASGFEFVGDFGAGQAAGGCVCLLFGVQASDQGVPECRVDSGEFVGRGDGGFAAESGIGLGCSDA